MATSKLKKEPPQQAIRRFSLNWTRDESGVSTAGAYTIRPDGATWVLRFRETVVHTGISEHDCKVEADWHRGISR
jgi:hypothetical protein